MKAQADTSATQGASVMALKAADVREAEQRLRVEKNDAQEVQRAPVEALEEWLFASGAPQALFHRCACQCRFRWPADARRIETRSNDGRVEDAIELAYCPACKSVRVRVLGDLNGALTSAPWQLVPTGTCPARSVI